jgi:alpha-glucosidase
MMRSCGTALVVALLISTHAADLPARAPVALASPNRQVAIRFEPAAGGRLTWSASFGRQPLLEPSRLGIVVDGVDLGNGATLVSTDRYRVDERYPTRGVHAAAVDKANGVRLSFRHAATGTSFTVDARAADDAVAFRIVVAGQGTRVPDAATTFTLPQDAIVWTHGLRGHYEELYQRRRIEDLVEGEWAGPPVTFKLPGNAGYASITEAGLVGYAGMALQAAGQRAFAERLGHSHPASYPYVLRYKEDNAKRLAVPAAISGPITTPWRVVLVGRDLNALVNSDAVGNLSAPAAKDLFPDGLATSWVKPGRAVWRYLDGGENSFEGIKEFSRLAAELGFEYQVVEGLWQKWTEAQLKELIDYSRERNVGIFLWRHSNTLQDPAARRALFESVARAGAVGLKVDFLDHEAKEVIDLYHGILRDAAEFKLMVNFHGANKPAGESRTWPNEVTREGIYGLEHRSIEAWATFNATMPFTRMLAGHADYTPVVFNEVRRKETSIAHQIATAVVLTSPLLVYGGHPASFLASPAREMLRSIPSVWDETRVLPPSEIGEVAVFARRRGASWFVGVLNGPAARTIALDLSFLGRTASSRALIVRDNPDDAAAVVVEQADVQKGKPVEVRLRPAGGFVMRVDVP